MITERDAELLNDLEGLRHVFIRSVVGLYYPSYTVACRRLHALQKAGCLKRHPSRQRKEWVYYMGRPCYQPEHLDARLELWRALKRTGMLVEFDAERVEKWNRRVLRCDAFFVLDVGDSYRYYFFEYERTTSLAHKVEQYGAYATSFAWEKYGVMPRVLVLTNKPEKAVELTNGRDVTYEVVGSIDEFVDGLQCCRNAM